MKDNDIANIHFDRVHRIGHRKAGSSKHRPIVAKVANFKSKTAIMERAKELKGTNCSISDQFPPEILRRRKLLLPAMADARKQGKRAKLSVDKLFIDGILYRNSETTYWITGGDSPPPNNGAH